MSRKSELKETKCLVASLKPIILSHKDSDMKDAQNIEGLLQYVIELFDGISRNEANDFDGKFDFSVSLTPNHFLIYKKIKGNSVTEKEYELFITAISIFQMVFIDENIYISGKIDMTTLITSKKGIIWGYSLNDDKPIGVEIDKSLAVQNNEKYVKKIGDKYILDFLPNVYRFNPFKEEKGNLMRHIVTPINSVKAENVELLSELIAYCKDYISAKKFELEL